jgi:predicted  nucleic acid-binding Zn-ribbon protein
MADDDLTERVLRNIQRELADMRDDRAVMIAMLQRLDTSVSTLTTELRAMRSQFDRWRNAVDERLTALERE